MSALGRLAVVVLVAACLALAVAPQRAAALNPIGVTCTVGGLISGVVGKVCKVVQGVRGGKKLLGGAKKVKGAAGAVLGGPVGRTATTALGLAAVGAWVMGGAKAALEETAKVIGKTTSPRLGSTWFSGTYLRLSGLAALLTLPFLFAAAIQAMLRSDLTLLAHAAFGYLPLALLATAIAAPLTMLLLAGSDEMCAIVASATRQSSTGFLTKLGGLAGGLSVLSGSPFLAVFTGMLLVSTALALTLELLVREAAVYVVVLMLPLAFAALVWPARRIWAVRVLETLVALILAKFVIVAVLALAGGALGDGGATGLLAGTALMLLAAFSPVVLFRVLPFAELAGHASGALQPHVQRLSPARAGDVSDALEAEFAARAALPPDASGEPPESAVPESVRRETPAFAMAGPGTSAAAGELGPSGSSGGGPGDRGPEPGAPGGDGGGAGPGDGGGAGPGDGGGAGPGGGGGAGPGGGGGAGPGGGGGDHGSGADPPAPEPRIPGMAAPWQAPDFSWEPLPLGFGEDWPPPLWPEEGAGDDDAPGDDPDGLPPAQDPEDGRL